MNPNTGSSRPQGVFVAKPLLVQPGLSPPMEVKPIVLVPLPPARSPPRPVPQIPSRLGERIVSKPKPLYKAAGILPLSLNREGQICVLLFKEYRKPGYNMKDLHPHSRFESYLIKPVKSARRSVLPVILPPAPVGAWQGPLPVAIYTPPPAVSQVEQEYRKNKQPYWIDVAGKYEPHDRHSWDTAVREFVEETGGTYIDQVTEDRIVLDFWVPRSKSIMYCLYFDYDTEKAQQFYQDSEMIRAQWIPLCLLLKIFFSPRSLTWQEERLYDCHRDHYHKRLVVAIAAFLTD